MRAVLVASLATGVGDVEVRLLSGRVGGVPHRGVSVAGGAGGVLGPCPTGRGDEVDLGLAARSRLQAAGHRPLGVLPYLRLPLLLLVVLQAVLVAALASVVLLRRRRHRFAGLDEFKAKRDVLVVTAV